MRRFARRTDAAISPNRCGILPPGRLGDNWNTALSSMDSDTGLESLMARYQQGDFTAAAALVKQLSPQLHRVFLAQFVSRRYADDLLQETWLRIHEVRHTYRPGQPVLPWLYAIARHIRVDHYRKARRAGIREQSWDENLDIPQPSAAGAANTPDLEAILATLPESQREVVAMLKVAGMSLEEVARATSSSVGSVKQKAHRAYERLRERLRELGIESARKGEPS
jgi:RNA polymerase sigma-70 factor (ECF subfamily)